MASRKPLDRAEMSLRNFGLKYPEAHEEFPWGHRAIKVRGKIFIILGQYENQIFCTVKLPVSNRHALALPFTSPTEYGMGKHGWVTARFNPDEEIPIEMLCEWIDESYRAIAPKSVLAKLEVREVSESRDAESSERSALGSANSASRLTRKSKSKRPT